MFSYFLLNEPEVCFAEFSPTKCVVRFLSFFFP